MQHRVEVPNEEIVKACGELAQKISQRLQEKGHNSYIGKHEILGWLKEEFEEVSEEVHSKRSEMFLEAELLDLSVACTFGIASLRANRAHREDLKTCEVPGCEGNS